MREGWFLLQNSIRKGWPETERSAFFSGRPLCRLGNALSLLLALCVAVPGVMLTGCGSGASSHAQAGPINFIGSSGATEKLTELNVASAVKLSMMPTNDSLNGGVDWTVTCGGNPVSGSITNGACGTLSPLHTGDGQPTTYTAPSVVPINTSVTITATVTSNPSQSRSVSLTIVAAPIGVEFVIPPPTSLLVNTTTDLHVQVANDPQNAGVVFTATCGVSACGSFNVRTSLEAIYTAPSVVPAGGTVTISATSLTDTTKSATAVITITTPVTPPAVTVSVAPSSLYVEASGSVRTGHVIAVVANDAVPPEGVDWSLQCSASSCGTISPQHTASGAVATYIAPTTVPSGGVVTITAKSTANPAVSASATANIVTSAPIVITMSTAPPASLTEGAQATLAATATNDTAKAGINWTATCGSSGACGSFNLSPAHTASAGQIVYTAPAQVPSGGVVTITASSAASTPSNSAVAVTTIVAPAPSISFQQQPPSTMTSLAQASVSATVANDVAPGGVNWSVQCGNTVAGGCGWITPVQTASGATATYTAPPVQAAGTSVTIVATSVANSSASVSSGAIAITPSTTPAVSFIPSLPAAMQPNATVNLEAAVANDATQAGVDWQVCSSGCGFFTIAPAIPAVAATATTPYVPPVPAVTSTSATGWPNGLPIPYTAPSQAPPSGSVAVLAMAHADHTKANSGAITITSSLTGPALSGVVQAGTQPVSGAVVSLYAAGAGGYASAAGSIASTTTSKNGSFTIPGTYFCPSASSQMYLVSSGGSAGSQTANPNLVLMTVLGTCANLSSTPVVVNEVTSVASAYATSQFSSNYALTGNASYLYLGTSSGNSAGIANAFATVNSLVDITTGQVRYFVPTFNATAPYATINTLADMLDSCAVTAGGVAGDGSACGTLFSATDLLSSNDALYNSVPPTDTLQAIFNAAQHPAATNYGYSDSLSNATVFPGLVTTRSPFQPILSSAPNDWSLSMNYTVGSGSTAGDTLGSFAIDAGGNLWITDTTANSVLEWNATGAAISTAAGYPAGGGQMAIDVAGNVWVSGNNSLTELTPYGTAAPGSPFAGVASGGSYMAFDTQSDLWIANGAGVSEYNNLGQALSPQGGYTYSNFTLGTVAYSSLSDIGALNIDSSNNVWISGEFTLSSSGAVSLGGAILSNPGGQIFAGVATPELAQMAADESGDMWEGEGNMVARNSPYAGAGSTPSGTGITGGGGQNAPIAGARGMALDGAGTLWLANAGSEAGNVPPSVLPLVLGGSSIPELGYGYVSQSLAAGPLLMSIDGSGNIWVLLANNTITEYVGAAAPTVNPTALALKNKKLGAKP